MKPNSKRRFAAGIVAALCLSLVIAACGNDDDGGGGNGNTDEVASGISRAQESTAKYTETQPGIQLEMLKQKPPTGKTVAWVFCTLPVCHADAPAPAVKKLGWKFDLYPYNIAKGPSDAAAAFNRALASKPDYIGYAGVFPDEVLTKQLNAANAAGIPTIKVTGERINNPAVKGCVICAPGRELTGRLQVDTALADAGKKTNMVYVYDPNINAVRQSYVGAKSEVAKNGEGSKIDPLTISVQKAPAETAQTVVNYLRRNPDTKYVLAGIGDPMTAVAGALKTAGLSKQVKLIYATPQKSDIGQLRSGAQFASVADENVAGILRAIDGFARLSVNEKVSASAVGWHQIIVKENAQEVGTQPPNYLDTFYKTWRVG